ncbi:MAG: septum formation inhibitor Maf [Ruminococcaceae bacterium]|nr:septum formation inhibitor Maf [Oscillospiraceae bacterium]
MIKIVLASNSPRRKEILSSLGLSFTVRPTDAEESADPSLSPEEYVKECARLKAEEARKYAKDGELVITADTMVFKDGAVLGKPRDREDARRMLRLLSGSSHQVCTGVSVYYRGKTVCGSETSSVYFADLSDEEIDRYIRTGEPMDKAGAYGIQSLGGIFVQRIEGNYFNIVGLPVFRLASMLKEHFGIHISEIRDDLL